jgi:hypothetical protein
MHFKKQRLVKYACFANKVLPTNTNHRKIGEIATSLTLPAFSTQHK